MNTIQGLLTKISEKTREIEEHYPELQKYLNETRITLPHGDDDSPEINKEALENHLNSLTEMVEKYKAHK
ncbi:hypothetical protein [Olleya aquimaris]|uniref:Uncharacterized protein n=1 Tax=Olleya aquimaris TaxID=639310 RepID=A0A327RLV6_9FLAO|nr:hypothetical protein [Olleya aquimaris]RAJ17869.1 hypothetical protein LY08_00139 [Olleya aquimaris]